MRGLGLAVATSVMLGVAPIWLFSVWFARTGGGLAHMWFWSFIEVAAFALVIWIVYQSRPKTCMFCGAKVDPLK